MAANITFVFTLPETKQQLLDQLRLIGGNVDGARDTNAMASWLLGRKAQGQGLSYKADVGGIKASGTVTFASIANNDTVTINGRIYTAKTSGAVGLQQFNIGGSDINAAIALAAKINADTDAATVAGVVTAVAAAGVVTVSAIAPGINGNQITIAISAHGSVSGSGKLTSGAQGSAFSGANG